MNSPTSSGTMPPQRSSQAVTRSVRAHGRIPRAYRPGPSRWASPPDSPAWSDGGLGAAYHRHMLLAEPVLIALGIVIALLVLLPARRLHLAGIRARWIAAYAWAGWLLAFAGAVLPLRTG